jgi:hypothetical protein
MSLRRLLGEPLLHFLLLGALLFALYGALNRGALNSPDEIVVDRNRIETLSAQFRRSWHRPPTADELKGLIDSWVREEVYYREGLAQQLDRDDPVVRRRVAQKLTAIADAQTSSEVSPAELQAWLDAHPDDYRLQPNYSLRQVFFNPARHGQRLDAAIAAARSALAAGARELPGDATMLPESLEAASSSEIARVFGNDFAAALARLPVGEWQGPVSSEFGVHLVMIQASQPGRLPDLAEVNTAVQRDLLRARAEQSSEAHYQSLRQRYAVRVEAVPDMASDAAARPGPLARAN